MDDESYKAAREAERNALYQSIGAVVWEGGKFLLGAFAVFYGLIYLGSIVGAGGVVALMIAVGVGGAAWGLTRRI